MIARKFICPAIALATIATMVAEEIDPEKTAPVDESLVTDAESAAEETSEETTEETTEEAAKEITQETPTEAAAITEPEADAAEAVRVLLQTIGARIAFFDEPTSNLDAARRENLAHAFRAIDVGKEGVAEHWLRLLPMMTL